METEFECYVNFIFQVKDLTKFLDPSGLGVISYEDFHRGISAISNGGQSDAIVFPYCKYYIYFKSSGTFSVCKLLLFVDSI